MILKELIKIKIGATKKERDPNWKTLAAKATSGASGSHKNSKRDLELGKEKHKKKFIEALDEYDQELELFECDCEVDWKEHNGNWDKAKAAGKKLVSKISNKDTDKLLKLKDIATKENKKGSYLGAVVVDLIKDHFEKMGDDNYVSSGGKRS